MCVLYNELYIIYTFVMTHGQKSLLSVIAFFLWHIYLFIPTFISLFLCNLEPLLSKLKPN